MFRSGVLNLLVLAYPQINVVPLCVPPNKNLIQIVPPGQKIAKETEFLVYFKYMKDLRMGSFELIFKLLAFKKLLAYPQWTLGVPPGVRVPQVENRCSRHLFFKDKCLYNDWISIDSINMLWSQSMRQQTQTSCRFACQNLSIVSPIEGFMPTYH
jgi:hypothetical protein